jgi:hypothetical protein
LIFILFNDEVENGKAGHAARIGEKRNAHTILVGRSEGKIPLKKIIRKWEDNIKNELRDIWCFGMDWNHLAQKRDHWRALVNTVMDLRDP